MVEITSANYEEVKMIKEEIKRLQARLAELQPKKLCSFCGKEKHYAKGLCRNCYWRNLRNGTAEYKQKKGRKEKPTKQKTVWYDKLYKDVFWETVFDDGYCKPDDFIDSINAVYETLTPMEQAVMEMRYEKEMTLSQIAKQIERTTERARQIVQNSLRKMRHTSRADVLKLGKEAAEEKKRKQEEEKERLLKEKLERIEQGDNFVIEDYDLGVREYNVLARAGIDTSKDVIKFILENGSIMKLRNCGVKTAERIYEKFSIPQELRSYI